jgi:hypothetical protein
MMVTVMVMMMVVVVMGERSLANLSCPRNVPEANSNANRVIHGV